MAILSLLLIFSMPTYAYFLKEGSLGLSPENPILVYSVEDLRRIGNDEEWTPDKHYKLMSDIVFEKPERGQSNWTPIGSPNYPFVGTFDGNNKIISGIVIVGLPSAYAGFFGRISGNTALIKNLGIVDISINNASTKASIGGLVGLNNGGTIRDSYVIGQMEYGTTTGGIASINYGIIDNCYFSGSITNGHTVGGIVGINEGYIGNSHVNINMGKEGISIAGGIAGEVYALRRSSIIEKCSSIGTIYGSTASGGIIGSLVDIPSNDYYTTIQDCFSSAQVFGYLDIGGIVARMAHAIVDRCYFSGTVTITRTTIGYSPACVGGLVGIILSGILRNCVLISIGEYHSPYLRIGALFGTAGGYDNFENNRVIPMDNLNMLENAQVEDIFVNELIGWDFTSPNPVWEFTKDEKLPQLVSRKLLE